MRLLDSIRFRFLNLFRRSQVNAEMDEELLSHIQHRADDLERSGLARAEAERQARIEFGTLDRYGEECHQAAGPLPGETLFRDVRYAIRVLRKSPGFTFVSVIMLALAIGANAVVFAALNALILRPLDLPRVDSLYSIHRTHDLSGATSYPDYVDIRARNRSFEDLAAYDIIQAGFDTGENPTRSWFVSASGNYFDVLGVRPHIGRVFHSSDEHGQNSAPYVVLAYAFWHTRFHDDPSVIGRVVRLNKRPFTVIGVAQPGFHGTLAFFNPDLFMPMVNQEQIEGTSFLNFRASRRIFLTMGHLKPGVTPEQASADMNAISAELEKSYPNEHAHATYYLARPSLYGDYVGRPVRAFITALMLLSGLILLAACANLGSLFAARAADRSREVALRIALGATRARVLRQLLTEAILISLAGGALGLWGSIVLLRAASAWQPFPSLPINMPLRPDPAVYVVALVLALVSGFLFGLVPVKQVLGTNPYEVVKSGQRTTWTRRFSGRDALVVLQISICAVLVTSSIVAVRGLVRSMHSDLGLNPANSLLVNTGLDLAGYSGDAVRPMQKRVLDAVEKIPNVDSVGMIDFPMLSRGGANSVLVYSGDASDIRPATALTAAISFKISPEYFRAAGTALLSGRPFNWHDDSNGPLVSIINQEFAQRYFGSVEKAIGRDFKLRDGKRMQIVGVVETGKYASLTETPRSVFFTPMLQGDPAAETWMVVRSTTPPQQLTPAVKAALLHVDSALPVFIQTRNESMDLVLFPSRMATISLGVLGIMGAMLSISGIFGMAAYSVSNRLRELGIRIALGAQGKEVLQAALGRAIKLLIYGSAAGLILGLLATKVLAFIVYEATPRDPIVLAGAVVSMLLLGVLATWIPAQRALSIDPLVLLREE